MQRLGNLNNKLIVESIYEPDNKNVIWKDTVNNEFKEYNGSGWVKSEQIAPAGQNVYGLILKDNVFSYTLPDTDDAINEKIGQINLPFGSDTILIKKPPISEVDRIEGMYILANKTTGPISAYIFLNKDGEIFVFRYKNTYGSSFRVTGFIQTNSNGYMTILKDVWDGILGK